MPSAVAMITMSTSDWCYVTSLGTVPAVYIAQIIVNLIKRILERSAAVGARAIRDGAVHGANAHGQYLQDCKIQVCLLISNIADQIPD